jgi:hypothetical protein
VLAGLAAVMRVLLVKWTGGIDDTRPDLIPLMCPAHGLLHVGRRPAVLRRERDRAQRAARGRLMRARTLRTLHVLVAAVAVMCLAGCHPSRDLWQRWRAEKMLWQARQDDAEARDRPRQ